MFSSNSYSKYIYYSLITVVALLSLLLGSFIENEWVNRQQKLRLQMTEQQLDDVRQKLSLILQNHIQVVRGLPAVFVLNPSLTQAEFTKAVKHLIGDHSEVRNIAAAPDMIIRYMYPLEGNEAALGLNYRDVPSQLAAVQKAVATKRAVIAGPVNLVQGGVGLIARIPVFITDAAGHESFWGIISSVLDINVFFEKSGLFDKTLMVDIAIRGKDSLGHKGDMIYGDVALFSNPKLVKTIKLAEGEWQITAQPKGGWQVTPFLSETKRLLFWLAVLTFALLVITPIRLLFNSQRASQKFRDLVESSPIPYILLNRQEQIIHINRAFSKTYGYQIDDVRQLKHWWHLTDLSTDYEKVHQTLMLGSMQGVISDEVEVEINCLNGEQKIVSLSASQYVDAVGSELLISVYDITARKAVEEQLRFSSNIFEQTHEGILLTDIDSKVIDVNPAFTKITGYSREEIIGQTANILNSGQHSTSFFKQLWQELLDTGQWQGEVWNKTKAGEIFPERLAITAIVDDEGDITHYVGMFSDITHMKAQQEKLELMAHYDVLTKLPNRVLLADRFSQAVAHSKRTDTMLAVCFLDLDGFKEVNDNYGHEIGDNLLIEVAKRLKEQLRGEDTLSRFGGDEFAIILRDIDNLDECEQLLHRVHDAVAEAYTIDGLTLNVSASTGFTMYPNDSSELDVLLRHADQAMYDAKLLGRNQFKQFDSDISVKTQAKQEAITRFQQAIADDELRLFFQPKVNMRTGVVYGMEALIRWQHPEKGLLPPGLFLPEVEGTHVEIALGNWVLKNAMRELNCWHRQGHQLEVSVNIDSIHLLSGDVISDVERVLADYPEISASFLQLEILETSDLGDIKVISTIIQSMKNALGVQVALDDFGTGYSSLAHLRHLFGTTIKIDQSFVRNMLDDPHDYSIVDGVIGLANSFNRQVIAEGVETVDHGIILEMMGCQLAQGYGIAKPMPAHEVVPWLQQYQQDKAWTHFGNQTFTPVQKSLIQFRILSQRWYDIFAKTIQNEETTSPNIWPKMDSSKCQCGKWIKVNRAKGLFSSKWFVELQQLHKKFHTIAYQIRESYITEDSIQAQKELDKLHDVLVDIQRHLPSEHHIR